MKLRTCSCGGSATIRTQYDGKLYIVGAVCESCGLRGKKMYANQRPDSGASAIYWAAMSWNSGLYEQEAEQ